MLPQGSFGPGYGPILIDDINCSGNSWSACSFESASDCSHLDDVAILCSKLTFEHMIISIASIIVCIHSLCNRQFIYLC